MVGLVLNRELLTQTLKSSPFSPTTYMTLITPRSLHVTTMAPNRSVEKLLPDEDTTHSMAVALNPANSSS